ncbi:MAG: recombinase family protein [Clostridia bacterium]|nr:recombinase family protein [Clostridia bacterium]
MLERIKRTIYKIAIYIRLSKEDADRGFDESESIKNQKTLLTEYVKGLGEEYILIDTYIDQGYTGTNFKRPAFQRMVQDIEQGRINMVITKDLSRLGRDYIETGEYIEKWFPEKNVRYVSVTDGIDTFSNNNGNNDIAPFKSILNDMYSKDLSKKIRTALHTMQKQGKWVGGKTALGYIKDQNDKNHLIICEEESEIIKTIFNMAVNGNSINIIRDYLNNNNIPTANQLRYNKASFWESKTIKNILTNQVYIGNTVQNKRSRISYKNRKLRANPKDEWVIVENTHESIIDKAIFEKVQKMNIAQKYQRNEKKNHYLLGGLLICYECKHKIGVKNGRNSHRYMICNYYRKNSKLGLCTSHGFNYDSLEEKILQYIKELFSNIDSGKLKLDIENNRTKCDYNQMLKKLEAEISITQDNLDKMYIEKLNNKISETMYERVSKKLIQEIKQKEESHEELKETIAGENKDNDRDIEKTIKEFLRLDNPTPELMKVIINKIEVHQDKQIDIIFNFKKLQSLSKVIVKTCSK